MIKYFVLLVVMVMVMGVSVDMVVFLCMFVFVFLRVIVLRETVKTENRNIFDRYFNSDKNYFSSFDGPCESGCSCVCEDGRVGSDVSCEKFSLSGRGREQGRVRGGEYDGGDQV